MPIEIPKGLPFSVDTWTPSSDGKRHHFLTHAHKDHTQGIVAHASYPIYSTILTRNIILQYYPQLDKSTFVGIEVGQSLIIEDREGDFTVTAFDANHCPGAVMFLFEGNFGNILHTGDCRLAPECLQNLPDKYIGKKGKEPRCPLDCIFLDCTFGQFPLRMPSRNMAIQQVINCIWKHPDAPTVYLTCDLLGQEEILVVVSKTFGQKIYVDKTRNLECFKSLELIVPDIISHDPSSRFQLLDGFPRLYERAEAMISKAHANFQHEPLILRASSQWYACDEGVSDIEKQKKERFDQAVRDVHGVWHICYSIHSSRDELEWALQLLMPKWVVSTTPNCRAMELSYVKKHCFKNAWVSSNSLQKLLDISPAASIHTDTLVESLSYSDTVENIPTSSIEIQSEPIVIPTGQRKRLSLSPPCKRPMITLFGRARLGFPDSCIHYELKEVPMSSNSRENISIGKEDVPLPKEDAEEVKVDYLVETERKADYAEMEFTGTDMDMGTHNLVEIDRKAGFSEMEFTGTDMDMGTLNLVEAERKADFSEPECTATEMDMSRHSPVTISPVSWPNSYNENLRRFYRSMNVPVPQRLPSLMKLMGAKKSAKQRL